MQYVKLFKEYKTSEPWDEPNNRTLLSQMPEEFACPERYFRTPTTKTSYVAIVGEGTAWPKENIYDWDHITDLLSQTIMLVEIAHSDIDWLEPRDLKLEELLDPKNAQKTAALFASHDAAPGGGLQNDRKNKRFIRRRLGANAFGRLSHEKSPCARVVWRR